MHDGQYQRCKMLCGNSMGPIVDLGLLEEAVSK